VIFTTDQSGMTGCRETALETMVSTRGRSPATAAMVKETDPWQWMTALRVSAPVAFRT